MYKNKLYLIRGIQTTGKSTLGKQLSGNFSVAADDYEGLYDAEGNYNIELQSKSHEWCLAKTESWMIELSGKKHSSASVSVCNTFALTAYLKPYIELAKKYDWIVQIVTCEEMFYYDENKEKQEFPNKPKVTENLREEFLQKFQPAKRKKRLGLSFAELSLGLKDISTYDGLILMPDAIALDMDNTLKETASGKLFAESPSDFSLISDTVISLKLIKEKYDSIPLYLVTNQRGIGSGKKRIPDYFEEVYRLMAALKVFNPLLSINTIYAAIGSEPKKCIITYKNLNNSDFRWNDYSLAAKGLKTGDNEILRTFASRLELLEYDAVKPNPGMLIEITKTSEIREVVGLKKNVNIWYVGDAHTDGRSEDYQAVVNANKIALKQNLGIKYHYIPVELFRYVSERIVVES